MPSVITPIIDTAIGVVVVYIAFSLLASWLGEQWSSFLKTRSKMLVGAITQLLSGTPGAAGIAANKISDSVQPAAAAAFFNHPIFQALKESAAKDPQYLSAQQFSSVLLGLVNPDGPPPVPPPAQPQPGAVPALPAPFDFTSIIDAAKKVGVTLTPGLPVPDTPLAQQLSALAAKANGSYTAFVKAIEDWYDDHMDRVSGWYVQHTQIVLILIGLVVAILWNVDSLRVVRALSCNAALRTSVAQINVGTKDAPNSALITTVIDAVPLGWKIASPISSPPERPLSCDAVTQEAAAAPAAVAAKTAADAKAAADRTSSDAAKAAAAAAATAKAKPKDKVAVKRASDAKAAADRARAAATKAATDAKAAADKAAPAPVAFNDWNQWLWWGLLKALGLVLTAVALSQGANFWFDTLSSLTRVRNAGKKPDTSPDASRA